MEQTERIKGIIERFVFQSHENGFAVFVLRCKQELITVKGSVAALYAGNEVELEGTWTYHVKFGKQFDVIRYVSSLPTTTLGLEKYLGSGLIKGIGKTYASRLIKHFGNEVLEVIEHKPERLAEVEGIGNKRIELISTAWKDQKEIANIMVFLQERDVSPAFATKMYKKYGQATIAVLHENPYRIADEIWGIGFKTADKIAHKIGFAPTSPERIQAGIMYALSTSSQQGHLYVELELLRTQTLSLLTLSEEDKPYLKTAFHDLYNKEKIKLIVKNNLNYIGSISHYLSEAGLAKRLINIASHTSKHAFSIDEIYQQLRTHHTNDLHLNEQQQKGVLSALQHKITIITGGPGTGKTTLLKKLLSILDSQKVSYKVAAPTGRAAKRITEGTGRYASTIHRLLEFDVSTMRFTHNENNALKLDFLIVDEVSMIDVFLAHALVKALPLDAHVILIGDHDQLPSVGPGSFLKDIMSSQKFPVIALHEIFRQARDSMIIINAHKINNGEFPSGNISDAKKDFFYIKENEVEKILDHLKRILFIDLKKHRLSYHDVQILVPMNRGAAGTYALNHHLQQLLNPDPKPSLTRMGIVYKEGDKIMQIRNNYDKNVFNGDLGYITKIDAEEKIVWATFSDNEVEYEYNELDELVLAYATSIHKSQGSEYPVVIALFFMQHFTLLQRNLVYTAVTRAKKLCYIIGEGRAIAMAIKNNKTTQRITLLVDFLHEII